jgi:enoyl-CoA hydratase
MLRVESAGQVVTLVISHAARRNAMTRAMWQALPRTLSELPPSTRCLIIRGEGDHFCAGGDISEYPQFRFNNESLCAFHEDDVAPALDALLALDVPVVAMIDGHCMGGGLEIAACTDIRIASERATFGAPIAKLGMPMAQRELAIVLRAAGEATVREMLLEAKIFSAPEMKARGFIQRIVRSDELDIETQQTAQRIAALSPQAARINKQFLRQIFKRNSLLGHIEYEQSAMNSVVSDAYAYADSAEHIEGITAFLAKRPAQF